MELNFSFDFDLCYATKRIHFLIVDFLYLKKKEKKNFFMINESLFAFFDDKVFAALEHFTVSVAKTDYGCMEVTENLRDWELVEHVW